MKRFFKIIYIATIALMIPYSIIEGQDKKSERKVKIIVNDGSGTKVLIDTIFKWDNGPDSLLLKDGSVVYMKQPHVKGKNHYSISYSSDNKEGGDEIREMTVISSDSMEINDGGHGNVMFYRNGPIGEHHRSGREQERDSDSKIDKTRFVIAKDGMVVTIEGTDEAKAKELANEIEKSLGVKTQSGKNQ